MPKNMNATTTGRRALRVAAILEVRDLTQQEVAVLISVSIRQFRRLVTGEVVFTVPQLQLVARKTGTTAAARSGGSGLSIPNWMPYSCQPLAGPGPSHFPVSLV
jgi:hypothetical protein